MKKLIHFFTNKTVISIIGLLALAFLIWFVGPYIKFGDNNAAPLGSATARLLCIIIMLVLWGLNNLRIQYKNKKHNTELVSDLQEAQDIDQGDANSEQSAEEISQISERFTQALVTLKKLKFRGKGRNKALYELPWYIIIGPPGSGKTTALVNSTLEFPLAEEFGKAALQGVGGTRNCDWWFTNDAVLVDTAGRYTTQDSHRVIDSSAWEGFLGLLKKHRRRRPINGAIVAISVHDLLIQTEQERATNAKAIRSRIDELMEKLEIRFPIYLMFTKTDLISGFSEFFEDLSKEDREQVWGVTLPNAPATDQSPDFVFLQHEYKKLLQRVYDRVLWRVHEERDVKRRGAIQGFPQQMENLSNIIDSFVKQAFAKNRYQYQPYLRGIYFSSGTQDGTPIDRLMSSVASNFGFSRDTAQLPYQQGKSFFLGRLFREVIFPESELVGSNRKYELFIQWAQRAAYVALAAIALGLIAVWAGSVTKHNQYMSEVESYIADFNAETRRLISSKDIRKTLPGLNTLAKASIVYDQDEHPWLSSVGLYDSRVDSSADKAYEEQLKHHFLPRLISHLERYIQQGHKGGDLYNTFRIYMMFNKTEYMDKHLVTDWFKKNWAAQYRGEGTRRKELEVHLETLLALDLEPINLNKTIVERTRTILLQVPVSKRVYSRIRTNPLYSQEVNILNQFGDSVRETYKIDSQTTRSLSVPIMFTIEGYENLDFSPGSDVISDVVNDRWVLSDNETAPVDFIKDDLEEISEQVKQHYFADYVAIWNRVITSLKVNEFTGLKHASDLISSFTDPVYSPLLSILDVTKTHTQLTTPVIANLADDNKKGKKGKASALLADTFKGTKVDQRFRQLHALLRETSKRPAPINNTIKKIEQLEDFISEVSVSPEPGKHAFQIVKARYQSGSGNAITSLRSHAKTAPEPLKSWLLDIADQAWRAVLGSAREYVNSEWQNQIYTPYKQALAGRYPLNRSARQELAIYDFTEFFKPSGTIDKFYEEFMKPFINNRGSWSNKGVDNYSMSFSSATLRQLRRAQNIKKVFFRTNPSIPSLAFQLKPYKMSKQNARFTLEVGDQRVSYQHGPKFWSTIKWSADNDSNRVRLMFEDLNESIYTDTYEGPWAWFRLQDKSKLKDISRSNVYQVTYAVNQKLGGISGRSRNVSHSIVYQIKAKSVNNPFSKNLLGAFKCPESI